jgi:hypothetical protein
VGAAPTDFDRMPQVAVLGDQGNVITRAGQLTGELSLEYARADRNRAIFRGIELVESVLVGVFDINESRQDILTAALGLRYGVTDRFELGVRLPYVYRNDTSILAPIAGSTNNDPAATIDNSAKGDGIGDLEISARYQLTRARAGRPFLIANLQAVLPTGTNPFSVPRDELGRPREAATGAGFYGISPSITGILQTDPAVLFGTIGYNFNLARDVDARIPPVQIDRVDPADAVFASAGIGIALNQRTSFNLGYAHTWGLRHPHHHALGGQSGRALPADHHHLARPADRALPVRRHAPGDRHRQHQLGGRSRRNRRRRRPAHGAPHPRRADRRALMTGGHTHPNKARAIFGASTGFSHRVTSP